MRYPAITFGPLPTDLINELLGTELRAGAVRLSARAHEHIAEDHPRDYEVCISHLAITIADPTFVGQSPRQSRNFEMIRRVAGPDGEAVLVAVSLEPDRAGYYRVVSSYLVTSDNIDRKRASAGLRLVARFTAWPDKTKGPG
jgi:phage-Barnase-EndoU-ColicinE5/D-RelE like nuclease2